MELPDHLGSSSIVLDKETGELAERSTYQAYGGADSDYRPDRWGSFREDYRFTGKEEDSEVGLDYFGKRYLAVGLNRWLSADPLAVHAPGQADLNLYAYVGGRALRATDPLGLTDPEQATDQAVSQATGAPSLGPTGKDVKDAYVAYKKSMYATVLKNEYYDEVGILGLKYDRVPQTIDKKFAADTSTTSGKVASGAGVVAGSVRPWRSWGGCAPEALLGRPLQHPKLRPLRGSRRSSRR